MNAYSLIVNWPNAVETLPFDPSVPVSPGQRIATYERWPNHTNDTDYIAEILHYRRNHQAHILQLRYVKSENSGQALESECWGTATLTFSTKSLRGNARWDNDPTEGNGEYSSKGSIRLVSDDLIEDLGYEWARRRKRKQEAFRKRLLRLGERCALSGEETGSVLEAAHIVDVGDNGGFNINNGLLLRADIHRLFDDGLLNINLDQTISWKNGASISQGYLAEAKSWRLKDADLVRVRRALTRRLLASKA